VSSKAQASDRSIHPPLRRHAVSRCCSVKGSPACSTPGASRRWRTSGPHQPRAATSQAPHQTTSARCCVPRSGASPLSVAPVSPKSHGARTSRPSASSRRESATRSLLLFLHPSPRRRGLASGGGCSWPCRRGYRARTSGHRPVCSEKRKLPDSREKTLPKVAEWQPQTSRNAPEARPTSRNPEVALSRNEPVVVLRLTAR